MANNLNYGDGAKGFFIMHGEKMALGVCVVFLALFFVMGSSIESLPEDQSPAKLAATAKQATARIGSQKFDLLRPDREPPAGYDLPKLLERDLVSTDPGPYKITATVVELDDDLVTRRQLRDDPQIFPPNQPLANVIVAAIAVDSVATGSISPTTGNVIKRKDPLGTFGPAYKVDPAELLRQQQRAAAASSDSGFNYGESSSSSGFSSSSSSSSSSLAGNIKTLPPYYASMIPGYTPGGQSSYAGESAMPSSRGTSSSGTTGGAVQMAESIVCVVTTVDFEKQIREFENKLSSTVAYDATFDQPKYLKYAAQVLDVTDDPDMEVDLPKIKPGMSDEEKAAAQKEIDRINQLWSGSSEKVFMEKWRSSWWLDAITPEDLANNRKTFLIADSEIQATLGARWYGAQVPEVADLRYTHPKLTSPIPPILMADYEQAAVHPDIPTLEETQAEKPQQEIEVGPGSLFSKQTPGDSASSEGYRSSGSGYGRSSGSGYGEGGYASEGYGTEADLLVPKKLVRFFHLGAKPGHTYRYRVRVRLIDPNNVAGPDLLAGTSGTSGSGASSLYSSSSSASSSSSYEGGPGGSAGSEQARELSEEIMTTSVRQRLRDVRRADELYFKTYGKQYYERYKTFRKTNWRTSDWSVASAPVTVPEMTSDIYAGSVAAANPTRVGRDNYYYKTEPAGNVAVSVWDPRVAVRVPAEKQVDLGSVLNFTTDADVLHPMDLTIRRIPGYKFDTDTMVVDMRGGETLPGGGRGETLTSPGEFLLIDRDGNLFTEDELDDVDDYRFSLLVEDEVKPTAGRETGNTYGESSGESDFPGMRRGR